MALQQANWYIEFLDADEQAVVGFESTKEISGTEIAAAGAFGVAGLVAARALTSAPHQKAPGEWVGLVVLTERRLLQIDGHGIAHSVDRSTITDVKLSTSKGGARTSRIDIHTNGATLRLHAPIKIAQALARQLNRQASIQVDTNEGSGLDLIKAIPVIFLCLVAAIALGAGLATGSWLGTMLGVSFLVAAEKLRRLLFPKKKRSTDRSSPSTRKWQPPQGHDIPSTE